MASVPHKFERYKEVIPDWSQFVEIIKKPLPVTFWINPLKAKNLNQVLPFLGGLKPANCIPLPHHPNAFKVDQNVKTDLGLSAAYQLGLIHLQEEVSMLPVGILNPKPGDRILDLCAAPGNKTLQAASLVGKEGAVVANEKHTGRIRGLRAQITRHGATNIVVHQQDAQERMEFPHLFNKILADVPCSCEGTFRKNKAVLKEQEEKRNHQQKNIAVKASRLLEPNGLLIYSTCTFRPEENEEIVSHLVKNEAMIVEKIDLGDFKYSPGLKFFNDKTYHPHVERCIRIWPHQNNTGGFFIAKLRKEPTKDIRENRKRGGL